MKLWKYILILVAVFVPLLGVNAAVYTIQRGDTLTSIASQFGTTVNDIVTANDIVNPNLIFAGNTLTISEQSLGASSGYSPVTGYQSRTSSYISAAASTIPVASTKDPSGTQIDLSQISSAGTVKVYMNLEAGTTRQELVYCTGVTSVSWTGCARGLSFQGGGETAVASLAFPHNAGSSIIITNIGQFYNQYISIDGSVNVNGIKTFTSYPKFATTSTYPTQSNEFATKIYVDNVGAGGFTASNVSTTQGLTTYAGTPSCPTAAACVALNASSTGSIAIDSSGRVYVSPTFGADKTFTVNGTTALNGATTISATTTYSKAPSGSNDIVNFNALENFVATGTAGITITAGQPLYMSTTSSLFLAGSATATTAYPYVGFSLGAYSAGQTVSYARVGGQVDGLSLTAGSSYYLQDSAGTIGTAKGTFPVKIGIALSSSRLLLTKPVFSGRISGGGNITWPSTTSTVVTGWVPTHISLYCTGNGNTISHGEWWANSNGGSTQQSFGTNQTSPFSQMFAQACGWIEAGPNTFTVTVATTTNGFTIAPGTYAGSTSRNVNYVAEFSEQ